MNVQVGLICLLCRLTLQRATINSNGYENVLVVISPEIAEDPTLVDSLKELLTKTSEELYRTTRKRSYLKTVKILLPQTWSIEAEAAVIETKEDAELIVDNPNPAYGDNPFTVQNGDCGDPGDFTHLTPWFIKNHDGNASNIFGRTDKILVHEWAKLRWGVFEEYGYPGDDKFPMFYYKTTWGPLGQQDVLVPNFCTDTEITGVARDIKTGGTCSEDPSTGLPDSNCIFVPDLDNQATSSYMALPLLDSVTEFCDDDEENMHNTDIPSKQNLYCDGKSIWRVILENDDFSSGDNEPSGVSDTTPEFVLIKAEKNKYVLVMDVSFSMLPDQIPPYDDKPNRAGIMKDAAKRWIKYEVEDGTQVGLVVFSDVVPNYDPVIYHMNTVNDDTREEMMAAIDEMEFNGKTCIGCGLDRALNWDGGLGDTNGGVIILITDGEQLCSVAPDDPTCLTIGDKLPELLSRQVRVVTVALGLDADPGLEELAVQTGGKSYFIDDSSGAGNINDAFSGSLTYQPGDVLGNTNTVVHQKDFVSVKSGDRLKGFYDIDISIGREVSFEINVKKRNNVCSQNLEVIIVSPDDDQSVQKTFTCSPQDFGVFRQEIPDLAGVGRWVYALTSNEDLDSVSVKVQSKSRRESSDPVMSKCWIATGSQEIDTDVNVKLAVIAEVSQGNKPVVGAKVRAEIERPPTADGSPQPPMELDLADNGSGADKIKNDGTYSRYFTKFTGKGRYSVKCQVVGDEDTGTNGGFIGRRVYPQVHDPQNPLCCGSNALREDSEIENTGNFTRQAAGGAFQLPKDFDPSVDYFPPGQVTDLRVVSTTAEIITVEFTSPGDDLDSEDQVAEYIIKFSATSGNLTDANFDQEEFNVKITANDLIESDFSPAVGGNLKTLNIKSDVFSVDSKYMMALKSIDEAGNPSKVSNKVQVFRKQVPKHCLPGWVAGPGGCFSFILYKAFDWQSAQHACQGVGAWLAEPRTQEISDFLTEQAQQQQQNSGVQSWWIGLTDRSQDTEWKWENGQDRATFTNWAADFPSPGSDDCAILDFNIDSQFKWSNTHCGKSVADIICQK